MKQSLLTFVSLVIVGSFFVGCTAQTTTTTTTETKRKSATTGTNLH